MSHELVIMLNSMSIQLHLKIEVSGPSMTSMSENS